MQQDKLFTAFFLDTTTAPGVPLTGLSATITIKEASSPYTKVVDNEACFNMGGGNYGYYFESMDQDKEYTYQINPNSSLAFIEPGVTDKRLNYIDKNISSIIGGGFGRNSQYDFNATDRENINKILERLTKLEEKELPEQEEIDFTPILNKIEEIKQAIPDNTEIIQKLDYIEDFVEEEVKDKEEEQKRKEEEEKQEIEAIKQALMEVDKEDRKNIIEALKQIDMEHEENIINALNSL